MAINPNFIESCCKINFDQNLSREEKEIAMVFYLCVGLFILFVLVTVVILVQCYCSRIGRYPKNIFLEDYKKKATHVNEEEIEKLITLDYHEVKDKNPEILKKKYDVICIGSGISGLVSSGLLSVAGKSVLILEQHDRLGGFTHEFTEKGRDGTEYNFCPGIHYLGKLGPMMLMPFEVITKGMLEFRRFEGKELYEHGPVKIEVKEDGYEQLQKILIEKFPDEKKAIVKYFEKVDLVVSHGRNYVMKKFSPWYIKPILMFLKGHSEYEKYANISVSDVFDEVGMKNDALKQFLFVVVEGFYNATFCKDQDFSTHAFVFRGITTKFIPHMPSIKKSGGGAFARAVLPNLGKGSHGVCNARVEKIIYRDGRVRGVTLSTGEELSSEIVISCAGYQNTYEMMSKKVQKKYLRHIPPLIKKFPYCGFCFVVFLGLNTSPEEIGMDHGFMVLTGNENLNILDEVRDLDPNDSFDGFEECYVLAVSNDVEPEFHEKYPGHSKIQVIMFMNEGWMEKFEKTTKYNNRGNEYEEMKRELETKILDLVFKRFPKMEEHIDYCDSGTNLTALHYVNTPKGSGFGMVNDTKKWMRMNEKELVNPVPGLYFCGADILLGVAGGVFTALNLCNHVLNRNLVFDIMAADKKKKKVKKE